MKLKKALIIAGIFLTVQFFLFFQFKSDKNLQIEFIDVGQGDSILVTTPNKQLILVDGGPNTNANLQSIIDSKFFFTQCHVNTIVATHPHTDHIKGLSDILDICIVDNVFLTNTYYESDEYLNFLQKVKDEDASVKYVEANDKFKIDNIEFTVLWPDYRVLRNDSSFECASLQTCAGAKCTDKRQYKLLNTNPLNCKNPNLVSIVLKLTYNQFDALLTGDSEEQVQEKLKFNEKIEVLKVPHHGANDSLGQKMIDKISPLIAIISAGKNNVYKHPHKAVLGAYSNRKVKTLRTDNQGTVSIKSDGVKFWIE